MACTNGHVAVVEELLNHDVDPTVARKDGVTPLFIACMAGNVAVVEKLLTNKQIPAEIKKRVKASINERCGKYTTPLGIAKSEGHDDIVKLL